MYHPTHRIIHTTAFVKPVVVHRLEQEIGFLLNITVNVFECVVIGVIH